MRVRPVTEAALVTHLADLLAGRQPGRWLRVAVDGAPATRPQVLAEALVDPLRVRGRAARHIPAGGFLRPASLRLEFGRTDPDAFYTDWLDEAGLRREVLDRLAPGGTGRVLPSLWDAERDRATRAGYVELPPGAVALVSGAFLLGGALQFDVAVHLSASPAALARRTDPDRHWTLPAFGRYEREVAPQRIADVVVRVEDPRRPALADPG